MSNPNAAPDDISAVVAFKNKIGAMWSDQLTGTVHWATRTDGTTAGDVLVASITADRNPTISVPSGWTPIFNNLSNSLSIGSGARVFAYWHVVGPSDPASYAWTLSTG